MAKRINQTSLHTFSDRPDAPLRYSIDFEIAFDDTYIRNHIETITPDGTRGTTGAGISIDAVSKDDYGIIVDSINTQLEHSSDLQALAEYRGFLYAQPKERVPALKLDPAASPAAMWPAVLDLEVSDAITVERFAETNAKKTLELNVEGMRISARAGGPFRVELRTSPRDTRTYFVLDSATRGTLDDGNRLAP